MLLRRPFFSPVPPREVKSSAPFACSFSPCLIASEVRVPWINRERQESEALHPEKTLLQKPDKTASAVLMLNELNATLKTVNISWQGANQWLRRAKIQCGLCARVDKKLPPVSAVKKYLERQFSSSAVHIRWALNLVWAAFGAIWSFQFPFRHLHVLTFLSPVCLWIS